MSQTENTYLILYMTELKELRGHAFKKNILWEIGTQNRILYLARFLQRNGHHVYKIIKVDNNLMLPEKWWKTEVKKPLKTEITNWDDEDANSIP